MSGSSYQVDVSHQVTLSCLLTGLLLPLLSSAQLLAKLEQPIRGVRCPQPPIRAILDLEQRSLELEQRSQAD